MFTKRELKILNKINPTEKDLESEGCYRAGSLGAEMALRQSEKDDLK